jgi:hypothetical protein
MQRRHPIDRTTTATHRVSRETLRLLMLFVLVVFSPSLPSRAQRSDSSAAEMQSPLTGTQVVRKLAEMNHYRAEALHSYEGSRSYSVEYRGFPGSRSANMAVTVKYVSPASKDFTVQSSTGSTLIIDKVFKKLLEAEKEALAADSQRRSALTEENYRFRLVGYESGTPNAMYVLEVEPRTKDKFLLRGKIWVDANDFAVVRMEVTPAKNPSFWTKSTEIQQVYKKVGDFWLPASNKSVSLIRIGGRAELTILYTDYMITGGDLPRPVAASSQGQASAGR